MPHIFLIKSRPNSMKISVQIPTYNQENYIERAIKSALAQDYDKIEIVVSDDNSTDNTFTIAQKYASPIVKVYKNKSNIGRAKNYRELLYHKISGDWVVNLDGDDYFTDPTFLSTAVEKIQSNSHLVFYQACLDAKSSESVFRFKHKILGAKREGSMTGISYFIDFHKNEFFGHLSTIYNVQKARELEFYQYEGLSTDAESLLKLAFHGDVYLDNRSVGVWNIHEHNESHTFINKNDENLEMFERIKLYSEPFVGSNAALIWFNEALKKNQEAYLTTLARTNLFSFLRYSMAHGCFNKHFALTLLKSMLRRKL